MKLLDFFTGAETWGEFWRLLDQLGDDSRFAKAQEDDEELAERLVALAPPGAEEKPWRPRALGWTLLHEMLARMLDRQDVMITLLADLPTPVKKRTEPPPPFLRPDTALARARARVKALEDQAYVEKIDDFVAKAKERYRRMKGLSDAVGDGRVVEEAPGAAG